MRTTLTLDTDVAELTRQAAAKLGKTLNNIVNEALRAGLDQVENPPKSKPYRTKGKAMGLRKGLSYDKLAKLFKHGEGKTGFYTRGFREVR